MLSIQCTNKEKKTVIAEPDGPIDGALRITVQSGDGTFEQDPAKPLEFKAVSGPIAGQTVYLVEADVKAGAEEKLIQETVELTVDAAEATGFGFREGPTELK